MDYAEPTGAVGDGDVDVEEVLKLISMVTVLSLGAVLAIILAAYSLSRAFLPRNTSLKIRLLFIWHIFDAMVHFALEGSYLFHCFFSWAPFPLFDDLPYVTYFPVPMTPYGVAFKGESGRLYGSFYSNAPMAKLWQEYARADRRWGGTDLTIISLELLTVFVMAPLSIYICHLLRKQDMGKAWLVMIVVATGELYGGFMTFAPEWLTCSPNLDTSNWMFLWLYLIFFNAGLWVLIPLWVLWEAFGAVGEAFAASKGQKPGPTTTETKAKTT